MLLENIKLGKLYKINKSHYKQYYFDALLIPEEFIKNNIFIPDEYQKDFWDYDLRESLMTGDISIVLTLEYIKLHLNYGIAHSTVNTIEKYVKCLLGKEIVYCDPFLLEELNL